MATVDLISLATQSIRPFESIPVIDISGLSGDANSKAQVANAIREACIHVGFFYVKNHGVDETVIKSSVDAARQFFNLSLEEKMKLEYTTPNFRGYYPITKKKYDHECFDIGTEKDTSNGSTSGSNIWPSEDVAPGFREAVCRYFQEVVQLGFKLLSAFALALNLPGDFFADKVHADEAKLRLMYYPLQTEVVANGDSGLGVHTEYVFSNYDEQISADFTLSFDCFTILWQDEVPALQVLNISGQWIDAEPMPGTFVINVANQLSRWTNDIFKSTVHRVINKSGARRYSMPLFFGADYNVQLEALPSCVSDSWPAHYEPILAGDHVKSQRERYYGRSKN
ncbi:unnamed protein product [Rhizoctonia solani]|uniref:Fe2OG dioxygenase domain-containing protein n=1 Tax=Rhizoctonia solani TaxID=456999 RepID=A0A8H2XY63_9AGAM|nr:unnamed protein product [Rhizoctonia solani]